MMNDLHLNVFEAPLRLVLLFILTAVVGHCECSADEFCGRRRDDGEPAFGFVGVLTRFHVMI